MALQPFGMMGMGGVMDPFSEMDPLLFGRGGLDVFNTMPGGRLNTRSSLGPLLRQQRQEMSQFSPILQADLIETENDFTVHVDLPGCDKNDLECSIVDNVLHIKAERKHQYTEESEGSRKIERTFGRMERAIKLPGSAKTDAAQTSFNNGVLSISFPKVGEAAKRMKLTIT